MRLTRFTDNALRCLLYLAEEPTRVSTVNEIATAMAMSPDHLLKVIKRLVELEYVRTIRGRNGGVQLATDAALITVAAVVRATEDNLEIVPCFDEDAAHPCPIAHRCGLAPVFGEALGAFFDVLGRYSIADLAKQVSDGGALELQPA
ncbi:MAG: Rrf2 family transcriptional regulator [Gemmatimonadota bacterium]